MKGVKPSPILATFVYGIIVFALTWISNLMYYRIPGISYQYWDIRYAMQFARFPQMSAAALLIQALIVIVIGILGFGFCSYCMGVSLNRLVSLDNLFDGFRRFWKVFALNFLMWLFTCLWSLLFVIPGIIAMYRYRMAYFILLENPDMGALDAIRASRDLMRGHKADLFVADLSFLPWALLSALTFGIVGLWLLPYMVTTYANFYQDIKPAMPPFAEGFQNN